MPQSVRIITTVTAAGATAGRADFTGSANRNITVWPGGVIGYSFTRYDATQTFWIDVMSNVMGSSQRIAGVSGVASTGSGVLPMWSITGTTTFNWIGIPTPVQAIMRGTSTGAGLTGVVVLTAALYSP
jgi:hypothetical protein